MLDETGTPIPLTSNNWTPIQYFDHSAEYAKGEFLVWLLFTNSEDRFQVAWLEDGRFTGEWRHIVFPDNPDESAGVRSAEPVAFKLVEGPDPAALQRILATYGYGPHPVEPAESA